MRTRIEDRKMRKKKRKKGKEEGQGGIQDENRSISEWGREERRDKTRQKG